jgi:hypothetical protein
MVPGKEGKLLRSQRSLTLLAINARMFDPGWMARPQRGPGSDRLIVARLSGTARRNARWGDLAEVQKTAGVPELREVAGDRADLLADVAGIALDTSEGKGEEYVEQGRAVAELCIAAGADQSLIPQWIDEGSAPG